MTTFRTVPSTGLLLAPQVTIPTELVVLATFVSSTQEIDAPPPYPPIAITVKPKFGSAAEKLTTYRPADVLDTLAIPCPAVIEGVVDRFPTYARRMVPARPAGVTASVALLPVIVSLTEARGTMPETPTAAFSPVMVGLLSVAEERVGLLARTTAPLPVAVVVPVPP
jgi:hypothetical protein